MKRPFLLFLCCLLLALNGYTQTKKIALASHNGEASELTLEGEDNFGLSKEMRERYKAATDSSRAKDTAAALVRKSYPPKRRHPKENNGKEAVLPKRVD